MRAKSRRRATWLDWGRLTLDGSEMGTGLVRMVRHGHTSGNNKSCPYEQTLNNGGFFDSPPDESGSSDAFGAEPDVPPASSSFCRKNEVFQMAPCSAGVSPPQVSEFIRCLKAPTAWAGQALPLRRREMKR